MSAPTIFASVVTNPGGTGSTIVPTLSTHAAGDVLEIFVGKTGNVAWSAPAGWTTKQQLIIGTASNGLVGTLIYRRVLPGDTLPLPSPTCTLGATVTRGAICQTRRSTDLESVHTLTEWLAFGTGTGTSNPIRPSSITTPAPEMEVSHYYCQRAATNAPEPTSYTQTQQIIISGTLVINVATRTISDQQTVLANQDASPTSGARWVGMISAAPSPDYPYYRSGSQAFNANATNVTPALPVGTSSSDNRGNKDLVVLTSQCAGVAPTVNTPGHWTLIDEWSNTTSGGVTTVRKWRAVYTGTLDRQVNRTPSGEIFAYLSVYHNAHQAIPIGTSAVQQNTSSTASTFPALPRTGTKATVQATSVADGTQTSTPPAGWTERNDSQGVTCADQSFSATGTTASASFTLNSASPTLAGLMEVFSVASVINLILTPATVTLTLAVFAPTIDIDVTVTPSAASLTLATFAPTVINAPPFPQTGELDAFNRADGSLGADWTGKLFSPDDLLAIDTNRVKGVSGGGNNNQAWATQFGPDCEAWVEIAAGSSDDNSTLLAARWSAVDTSTPDGYAVRARGGATNNVAIFRFDDGGVVGLGTVPQVVSDGDSLGMRVLGSTITLYYKDVSGVNEWRPLLEVTDTTYTAAGFIGLFLGGGVLRADGFGGGTLGAITVEPTTAVLTLTSFAPSLILSVTPTTTALTLATFAPIISISVLVTPATAGLVLTTFAPVLQLSITPATASLTTTALAPQLEESITPTSATLVLTTLEPSVIVAVTVTPTTALLILTTFAPTVVANVTVTPTNVTLVLTAFAPSLTTTVTPASASLSLTTFAVQLREVVAVGAASLSLTTFVPEVIVGGDVVLTPSMAVLTLVTFAPTLSEVVTPASSMLTLVTFAPVLAELTTTAPVNLALTTFAPTITTGVTGSVMVTPAAASLALTSYAPFIVVASPTPASRTFMVSSARRTFTVQRPNRTYLVPVPDREEVLV